MPVCPHPFHHARTLSLVELPRSPSFLPPRLILSRSSFPARLSRDMCLIFAAAVDFRPLAPACASTCVHLRNNSSSLFFPRYSVPFVIPSPVPTTPSSQSVTVSACCRHGLRHIYPSLCINFSSLSLSFPFNDQYFVTLSLYTLGYSRDIKSG